MLKEEKDNLVKIYENSFRNNWELPALTDWGTTTTFTYGQLAEQIARLHVLFERVGLQKEDKVSLMGKNTANWCSVYLATVTYGAMLFGMAWSWNRWSRYLPYGRCRTSRR